MKPYEMLSKDAQQLIGRGLQALVEIKQRELAATQQSLIVIKSVMAHPEDPTRWPLPAPWPEGWVVRDNAGKYICLNHYKLPRDWTAQLSEAYVWKQKESAERLVQSKHNGRYCTINTVDEICRTIGGVE